MRLLQQRLQYLMQLPSNIRILSRILHHFLDFHIPHIRLLFTPRADQFRDRNRRISQIILRQNIHIMTRIRINKVMRNHRVKQRALYPDPVAREQQDIVFQVLPHFLNTRVFKNLLKNSHNRQRLFPVGRRRHIIRLSLFKRERKTHDIRHERVDRSRLRIKAKLR